MNLLQPFAKTWIPPGILFFLKRVKYSLQLALLSVEDKRLLADNQRLKDRHTGSRCFILGAGSSVKSQDITKLKGEIVVSVSNTFVHHDFSLIKPRYHVVPSLIQSHGKLYTEDQIKTWLNAMETATGDAEMFFHIGDRKMIERNGLFKDRIVHWVEYAAWNGDFDAPIDLMRVPVIWSVSELALTVAVYLGFDRIFLVGMDHDWFNGPLVYFYDHVKEHAMKPDSSHVSFADSEFQMRRHAEIFRKYKYLYSIKKNVYNANANPSHYLDVFPKVDYDALFVDTTKQG
jgi:hypothetical protein